MVADEPTAPDHSRSLSQVDTHNNNSNNNMPSPNQSSQPANPVQTGGTDARNDNDSSSSAEPSLATVNTAAEAPQQQLPSQRTLTLWREVATGIDKSQTVVWKNAVDSLEEARRFIPVSSDARAFAEKYMKPVISILLEQQPLKIGQMERSCVEESLQLSVIIVTNDLKLKAGGGGSSVDGDGDGDGDRTYNTSTTSEGNIEVLGPCVMLEVLAMVFNRKKMYYKGSKQNWNNNMTGLPEVRTNMINKFRSMGGFDALGTYLHSRVTSTQFPALDILHPILVTIAEALPPINNNNNQENEESKKLEESLIFVAKSVMNYMGNASEDLLKKISTEDLSSLRYDLNRFFERLDESDRKETYLFYDFCRQFTLKLITSQSLPLKLYGWDTVTELIDTSTDLRPPPRQYVVSGAGISFVNGTYDFAGQVPDDGYARSGTSDIKYELEVPKDPGDLKSETKKITLFRCTMRSQHKWWFISEADEDQPGTDKDIDYYQHKSKKHEEAEPPLSGWLACKNDGIDPAPVLQSKGFMVPEGEEYNTMEHQLAKWAIENRIVELVLGSSIHREIVARSVPLIKFLAFMCSKDELFTPSENTMSPSPNVNCLQFDHLKLAWETCTSKLDTAVSAEVYQLLVSILPSLPKELAIKLLTSIQASLCDTKGKNDCLLEVAEFCLALSDMNPNDLDSSQPSGMSDDVRAEVLKLLWAVLTHPDASSLKFYEKLKSYITNELRVEPMGTSQRQTFMESCKQALSTSISADSIDEELSLRLANLTRFVLESCPREQAVEMIMVDNSELAHLVFGDLTAYLNRRRSPQQLSRKPSSISSSDSNHPAALIERLHILRYVYGLADNVNLTITQLDTLWSLCVTAEDREALMVFLANASNNEVSRQNQNQIGPTTKQPLSASYSDEAQDYTFESLFCSSTVDWERLGLSSYQSFQGLFKSLKKSTRASLTSNGAAIDALWRICLAAGNDDVASQAMRDLLSVYSSISVSKQRNTSSNVWTQKSMADEEEEASRNQSFARRIFECLKKVKQDLIAGIPMSARSAERCIRILNAAIGQSVGVDKGTSSALVSSMSVIKSMEEIIKLVPHGTRGQSCYRTISILAKRTSQTSVGSPANVHPGTQETQPHMTKNKIQLNERFSLQVHPLEPLSSVKLKVSNHCKHPLNAVKPISCNSRQRNLNIEPESALVTDLGIYEGCEVIFLLGNNALPDNKPLSNGRNSEKKSGLPLEDIFGDGARGPSDGFFDTLLGVLEALPNNAQISGSNSDKCSDTQRLVWDLLLSVPSNTDIVASVFSIAQRSPLYDAADPDSKTRKETDMMSVDVERKDKEWNELLSFENNQRSVYVMQVLDSFLQPATEILQHVNSEVEVKLAKTMTRTAGSFRHGFIESGGFDAVLRFFNLSCTQSSKGNQKYRMGSACALRILKCCFFGCASAMSFTNDQPITLPNLDAEGMVLMKSVEHGEALLRSLTLTVVADPGVSDEAILDVLLMLQSLLFTNKERTETFASLPNAMAQKLTTTLLLWESKGAMTPATVGTGCRIRKTTEELVLLTPSLSQRTLPWMIESLDKVSVTSDTSEEFFSVFIRLVSESSKSKSRPSATALVYLKSLGTQVCKKLASIPRPSADNCSVDYSTGVLCGCLKLLKALIHCGVGTSLSEGVNVLMETKKCKAWSQIDLSNKKSVWWQSTSSFFKRENEDTVIINLMGSIFDGFLWDASSSSSTAICSDKKSRRLGFEVVTACATSLKDGKGQMVLAARVNEIVSSASPSLRHRWGQLISNEDRSIVRGTPMPSKYSGLRNQGCTCYMNSVLQQLFMMPELQKNICAATLPSTLRSCGSGMAAKGADLVGKHISLQWESGASYDSTVEGYNESTGAHVIRYHPLQVTSTGPGYNNAGSTANQDRQELISQLPKEMPDEFVLTEGRPGKETGSFDVISSTNEEMVSPASKGVLAGEASSESKSGDGSTLTEESEDEALYRRLLEEVQRTFVHLDEGARGRVFDPRSLVEASGCLKLEFDVWQQNDASEFAMKLLDRLEVPLKRWSPMQFKYLEHTFRLKQTKQKLCKECGLKTNREENLMNIDCQIRGKSDIHEALSTMCEVEYMEGDNKVFCDRCKKNTDTILRTAISALPDMLILSLKRFDLDYTTFETVKLNSRCAFDQTLNMKRYTLEGVEAMEKTTAQEKKNDGDMDTSEEELDPLSSLNDEDYEYKLAGVLVHHGVAQGGHYYSFIRDRSPVDIEDNKKWYRFDDEDVTPFDPSLIEAECFGGKVKKETKWPNGQVNTMETDQLANALMLFYEKVKPADWNRDDDDCPMDDVDSTSKAGILKTNGIDVFETDVKRSNNTHRSHAFLFDSEFQEFLKGILEQTNESLEKCNNGDGMEISSPTSSLGETCSGKSDKEWYINFMKLAFSFYFDVLLHSVGKDVLDEWTNRLETALHSSTQISRLLVQELAVRTRSVNGNWLRIYLSDCPEDASRSSAVRVFAAAINSCTNIEGEVMALASWTNAWTEQFRQWEKIGSDHGRNPPLPLSLEAEWAKCENTDEIDDASVSSVGIIISFLCSLLEVAPRTWCYNSDLCALLREMANIADEAKCLAMRKALVQAQIPARLVCLIIREKAHPTLREAMPGASLSLDIAESMTKQETSLSSHLLPLGGNVSMNPVSGTASTNSSAPVPSDYLNAFEALASIIGIDGAKSATLVYETGKIIKGRSIVDLTKAAQDALTAVFNECAQPPSSTLGQNDILNIMKRCGVEQNNMSQQKIVAILNKYGNDEHLLTLDGFLTYYRDTSQSNEVQVRSDLSHFGFRPDLSKCFNEAIFDENGEPCERAEMTAKDVALSWNRRQPLQLGFLAELGLSSLSLYTTAHSTSSHLAEYILARTSYKKDTSVLLTDSLRSLYRANPGWAGNEVAQACMMIFKVLASIPDEMQKERITALMRSMEKVNQHSEVGSGLILVARELSKTRSTQQYHSDYHHNVTAFERYIEALKEMRKLRGICNWMLENKQVKTWLDQFLQTDVPVASHQQARGDDYLSNRRDTDLVHQGVDHNPPSDNDSDDESGDSRYRDESFAAGKITVSDAGLDAVNGVYTENGSTNNVTKYAKKGVWNQREEIFSLFRCHLSDGTQRWYISIVPKNIAPGTNKDVDFYYAPSNGDQNELPSNAIWATAKDNGLDPPPTMSWQSTDQSPPPDQISDSVDDPLDQNDRIGEDHNTVEIDENADEQDMCFL